MSKNSKEQSPDYKKLLLGGGITSAAFLAAMFVLAILVSSGKAGEGSVAVISRLLLFICAFICGLISCGKQSSGRLITAIESAAPILLMAIIITVAGNSSEGIIAAVLLNTGCIMMGSLTSSICTIRGKRRRSRR